MSIWMQGVKRMLAQKTRTRPIRKQQVRGSRKLGVEVLEGRWAPAAGTLAVVGGVLTFEAGGGTNNNLTLSFSAGNYTLSDTADVINLGAGLSGWTGGGTNTVSGPYGGSPGSALSLNLGDGADTANLRSLANPTTVLGGDGSNAVNVSSNAGTNTGNLAGIAAAVTVTADQSGSVALTVSDFSASSGNANVVVTASQVQGFAGPSDNVTISYTTSGSGSFSQLRLIGSNSPSLAEAFTIQSPGAPFRLDASDGADQINVQGLTATATINGGAGNDTISVASASQRLDTINAALSIDAGTGSNSLTVDDSGESSTANSSVVLTSSQIQGFAGSANATTISYKALGGSFSAITLRGSDTLADSFQVSSTLGSATQVQGGGGNDSVTLLSATAVLAFDGGSASDTLTAANAANTWHLTGSNAGDVNAKASFANVENLNGGTLADSFVFSDGKGVSGTIDGKAGSDTLDYGAYTTAVSVNLQTGSATGTGGFAGIENAIGGSASDSLTGADTANTWHLTGSNAGDVNGTSSFTSFENLNAGSLAASSVSRHDTLPTGTIDGKGGSDTLDYGAYTAAVSVNLQTGSATGTGGFAGIEAAVGGSASDSLTGADTANTWHLTGSNSGDVNGTFSFSLFENLSGGSAADSFVFSAGKGVSGTIDGKAGSDSLAYGAYTSAVSVNLQTGAATGTGGFANIEAAVGGSASDSLTGADTANAWHLTGSNAGDVNGTFSFTSFENLSGGSLADSFVFSDGNGVSGSIDGKAGSDTLDYSAYTSAVSVTLAGSAASGYASTSGGATGIGGAFAGINGLIGGSAANSLTGSNAVATWVASTSASYDDGAGNGSLTFSAFASLNGGNQADTFNVTPPAAGGLRFHLDGGDPTTPPGDVLTFDAQGAAVSDDGSTLTASGFEPVDYAHFETVVLLNTGGNLVVQGTDGNDSLTLFDDTVLGPAYQLNSGPVISLGGATSFTFNGLGGADTLKVDFANGNPIPTSGVTFNGGGDPGDNLVLANGAFDTTTYNYSNLHDGSITLDPDGPGGAAASLITYTGLAPLDSQTITAAHVVLN